MPRVLLVLLLSLVLAAPAAAENLATVRILHTNDLHGQIFPLDHEVAFRVPGPRVGGFGALATAIGLERAHALAANVPLYLVDGGDMFQGTPPGDLTAGAAVFDLMAELGYTVGVLGNHDFDRTEPALAGNLPRLRYPLLGANVFLRPGGERPPYVEPYRITSKGGIRVAWIGLMTEELEAVSLKHNVESVRVDDAVPILRRLIPKLRRRADVIVLITHDGVARDREIARAVRGIDLIVGSHTHTPLQAPLVENGTPIVQAGSSTRYLGRVDLVYDRDTRRVRAVDGCLLPLTHDRYYPNLVMERRVEAAAGEILRRYGTRIGETGLTLVDDPNTASVPSPTVRKGPESSSTPSPADDARQRVVFESMDAAGRPIRKTVETNLGNVVTDALLEATRSDGGPDCDLALTNITGIRSTLARGPISLLDVYRVSPFDNTLSRVELTGADLRSMFDPDAGHHAQYLQISGGRVTYHPPARAGAPPRLLHVEVGGKALDPGHTYRVVTNSFLAAGGDGYVEFRKGRRVSEGPATVRSALEAYVRARSPLVRPVESRIRLVEAAR